MFEQLASLRFASDATFAAIAGGMLLLLAAYTMWAENRRVKRKEIDRVGWMPWTKLFFIAALLGITLVTMAVKGWVAG